MFMPTYIVSVDVLQYFGEKKDMSSQPCCDVCECSQEKRDCSAEIMVILQTIKELSTVGEKKEYIYVQMLIDQ